MSHPYMHPSTGKAPTKAYPTAQEVLEWARSYNGVVLSEWVRNPTRCKLGRIVFQESRESRRASGTCGIVKQAINQFYPHVPVGTSKKHSCIINVQQGERVFQVMILESNVPWAVKNELTAEQMKLEYPPYGKAFRESKPTIFLEVTGVHVYDR